MNARQQVTAGRYGGNLNATFGFDNYGFPTSTVTGSIQNDSCNFNAVTGNLNWRQNNKYSNLKETFNYDNLDRLDNVYKGTGTPVMTIDMEYDPNKGSITLKDDVGSLFYNTSGKHYALSGISPITGLVDTSAQSISYTSFESIDIISENDIVASFTYNSDNQRAKMVVQQNGNAILTRWYPSSSYIKETAGGVNKEYTFIGGNPYTAPVVAIKQGESTTWYYLLRDYLGNITHVVNSTDIDTTAAKYSYDAWGRMRVPQTWINYTPGSEPALFVAGRGFTGHEHLPWFNLINMNGRVYDPLIGQFLSPDNNIQASDFTQNFNRYSYYLNNPLKYTDPDGEWFITALITLANMWLSTSAANDFEFNPLKWDWGSPKTWVTLGQSAFSGYKIGSSAEDYVNDKIMDFRINRLEKKFESINSPNYTASLQDGVYNQVDGLFIKNEKLAYNFIWNESIRNGKEYGAFITPNGVLVTPTYLNTEASGTIFGYYQTTWEGKSLFVNTTKAKYQVIGALHTHQMENSFYGYYFSGDDEWTTIALKGLPHFVLNRDNTVFAQYAGFIDKDKSWYCFPLKFNNSRNDVLNGFSLIKFILNGN